MSAFHNKEKVGRKTLRKLHFVRDNSFLYQKTFGFNYSFVKLLHFLPSLYANQLFFCFGSLVILDVACCYLWLFSLYININLCDERRDLKKKRYEAEGAKEYREANRRIQKAVKKAKEDWIGAQCEEIETCLNKNNSKRAYQLVKDITSEKQGRSSAIQDKSGKCVTEENEILSRWTEYCSEL